MNYELAKELKDAGFPQQSGEYLKAPSCDCRTFGLVTSCHMAYLPTLSELIEMCGAHFMSLSRTIRGWMAEPYRSDITEHINYVEGSTPEEAVARLWLALNKPTA